MTCPCCEVQFKEVRYWQRHFMHHHGHSTQGPTLVNETNQEPLVERMATDEEVGAGGLATGGELGNPSCAHEQEETDQTRESSRQKMAEFLLALRSEHVVSEEVVQLVVDNVKGMILSVAEASDTQEAANDIVGSLDHFRSQYNLKTYCEKHMPHVSAKTVAVEGGVVQYVPIIEQLKVLIENGVIQADDTQCPVIDVILYQDEFVPTNPLRGKAKTFKLTGTYFSIDGGSNSRTDDIFLLMLFRSSVIETAGMSGVLQPLIADLKSLTEGVDVATLNGIVRVKCRLKAVCGDNLGVHQLAGFQQSFSSGAHPCRYCDAQNDSFVSCLTLEKLTPRTQERYEAQVKALEESEFDPDIVKLFGIKTRCCLSDIPGFEVVGAFPPDIAHDVFEGSLTYVMCLLLTFLIVKIRLFSLRAFNKIVASFPLARCDKANRPSPARLRNGEIHLPLTAAECWTLGRLLPLMIGSLVPSDLDEWKVFVEMMNLVELICCPAPDERVLSEMQCCIQRWLVRLVKVFNLKKITPKLHYLMHYASEARRHGALRRFWTLRFESKHQVFKRLLVKMRSTKAVCKMLATRHQESMAFRIGKKHGSVMGMKRDVTAVRAELGDSVDVAENACYYKKATVHRNVYHSGDVIIVRLACGSGEKYVFMKVKFFVAYENVVTQMIGEVLLVHSFDEHLHSYAVERGVDEIVNVTEIVDFQCLGIYAVGSKMFIPLRHYVIGLKERLQMIPLHRCNESVSASR